MLYREGGGAPTVKHETLESAKREAERLVREHGGRVYVLEAIASARQVVWEGAESRSSEDIPF